MNIEQILADHSDWVISNGKKGKRANFQGANFQGANFQGANFQGANFRDADFRDADFQGADLRRADLRDAKLWDANFRDSDLWRADLRDTDLRRAIGNMKEIKSLQIDDFPVVYTSTDLFIGCQCHTIDEWWGFTTEQIEKMETGAGVIWQQWKPILQRIIKLSPAEG